MNKTISLFDWRSEVDLDNTDNIGEDLILFESSKQNISYNNPFKLDISVVIISTKGMVKGSVNLKSFTLQSPALLVIFPEQILELHEASPDYHGYYILMSKNVSDTIITSFKDMYYLKSMAYEYPCIPLSREDETLMLSRFEDIRRMIRNRDNVNRLKIITLLAQVMSLDMENIFHLSIDDKQPNKKELFVKSFIDLVEKYYREQRGVKFYADRLSLTPKYFSRIIKQETGKSATEWINSYVLLEATALLKSTDMTIQQISIRLNFPTQSHFGKYFKNHTGKSPKAYRQS